MSSIAAMNVSNGRLWVIPDMELFSRHQAKQSHQCRHPTVQTRTMNYPDDIGPGPYPIRYIGGPNDGTKERRDDLPEHLGVGLDNGQVANYIFRGHSDGNGTIKWTYQYVDTI